VIVNGSSAELGLPGGQPLRSGRFQRGHPGVVVGRAQVFDLA
jgi:hypothetical protein